MFAPVHAQSSDRRRNRNPLPAAQAEFDEEDVPEHFRFEFQSAPCSKHQEIFRMGVDSLPCLVLLTKVRARARGVLPTLGLRV